MTLDTFVAFVGVYDDVAAAEADYDLVKDAARPGGPDRRLRRRGDRAPRRRQGEDHEKHETPTRVGGVLGGGAGWRPDSSSRSSRSRRSAAACWPRPPRVARSWVRGRPRGRRDEPEDLKELGEPLDAGQAGLVVVGAMDMEPRIEESMRRSDTNRKKRLTADAEALERDAREVSG